MSPKNEPRPNKAERTSLAREQAKKIREEQLKKEKRRNWLIRGGVLVTAVVLVVVIALVVIQMAKNNEPVAKTGPVPANANIYGGVTIGKDKALIPPTTTGKTVDIAKVPAAPNPVPAAVLDPASIGIKASAAGEPVQLVVYLDFMCPACNQFETANGPEIDTLREAGKVTVEYRPLNFLDRFSSGTNYSSRSAAAAACVADTSPAKYKSFLDALFANQPAENSKGLDNSKLKSIATGVGAADISKCVDAKTFRPYVAYAGAVAVGQGLKATPTVFVDGVQWQPTGSSDQFTTFLNKVLAEKK